MEQISGTTPGETAAQAQDAGAAAGAAMAADGSGFGSRGRMRRRARFLRKAREFAYRDLGGLVYNLHRFGARNDALVLAKLNLLVQMDSELRALERVLHERRPITVLREAGITACPRCAAIHSSEDRFCPNCGLSMGRHPDLPIAGPASAAEIAAAQPLAAPPASAASPPASTPAAPAPAAPRMSPPSFDATQVIPAPAAGTTPGQSPRAAPAPVRPPAPGVSEDTEIIRPPAQKG